ncbi:glycoside hydrolase [Methylobacterium sp. J-092]|uniref:glycoside hydrolase n=1 Tax=Methylobacterium sp. J-092 TaxID=2836667 RepID=UPI001FBB0674|nr:glycoside hydrolase [Methylobacterium sp. J-092]MCJ2009185.1 glycoside hydrolase [Methylobacterium sp. J-092]
MTPADRPAFLAGLRGTPYDRAERHCWWLASLLQAALYGRELPGAERRLVDDPRARAAALASHPARSRWQRVSRPVDGALVLMGRVAGRETHCGVYLAEGGGRIWHTDRPHGVVADAPLELAAARGWRLAYFVPVET